MITIDDDGEFLHIFVTTEGGDKYIKTKRHAYEVKITNVDLHAIQHHWNNEYDTTTIYFKGDVYEY